MVSRDGATALQPGQQRESLSFNLKNEKSPAWCLTPVIPALWEPEVGGSRGQETETILVNKVKPRLY